MILGDKFQANNNGLDERRHSTSTAKVLSTAARAATNLSSRLRSSSSFAAAAL
jgi:hypothetical protein